MIDKPFFESTDRNGSPILEVLRSELSACTKILEIGSGTGQHAARFAKELAHLCWQTSDLDDNHDGIRAWVTASGLENLLPPMSLDVLRDSLPAGFCDGVYSSNTAHIMSFEAVRKMFALVGNILNGRGVFCLYGPFRQGGEFNTASNATFDGSLRARNPDMGIRDLESLDELAEDQGMKRVRLYAMPANNHISVWRGESE